MEKLLEFLKVEDFHKIKALLGIKRDRLSSTKMKHEGYLEIDERGTMDKKENVLYKWEIKFKNLYLSDKDANKKKRISIKQKFFMAVARIINAVRSAKSDEKRRLKKRREDVYSASVVDLDKNNDFEEMEFSDHMDVGLPRLNSRKSRKRRKRNCSKHRRRNCCNRSSNGDAGCPSEPSLCGLSTLSIPSLTRIRRSCTRQNSRNYWHR